MSDRPSCPPPELLCQLIDGKIVDPVMTDLTRHLDECPSCQSRVPTLLSTDTLVNSLRGDSTVTERMLEDVPQPLIDALLRIPEMDSGERLSADGLSQNRGMSLDDLGLSFLTPPQEPDEIGRLGHYRILRVLGRGGMGIVFLAEDPKLGRQVALKVILPRIANIPAARDRFLREAKVVASLKSDYIVTVYQVDEANGLPFLAMELLQGETLDQSLRTGRRFSISETIQMTRDIANGLAEAHAKGLVHRDIKPANLWLEQSPEGKLRVKILDFGLARTEREDVHLTEFGTIVGTPAFMSPEQGHADRPIDSRADLFALGAVLYMLCTGEMPFQAETTVGILMALALKNPIPPKQRNESVPAELSDLTMQLLEKEPADRPQSARVVLDRLQRLRTSIDSTETKTSLSMETLLGVSKPILAVPKVVAPPPRKSAGRGRRIATWSAFTVLLLIAAQVYLWQTRSGQIVRIECNDPTIKLAFEGGDLNVVGAYDYPVKLTPGKVDLKIIMPRSDDKDFVFETNKLVVRKNEQIALKVEVLDAEIRIVQDGQVVDSKSFVSSTERFAALVDAMRKANPGFDGAMVPGFEGDLLVSLDFRTDSVTDLSPLREARHLRGIRMDGDSSPDHGVSDLSPLQGLPLTSVYIYNNSRLTDLSPLRGMQLQELQTDGCPIAGFGPLAGMPLRILRAWSWTGSDLSPLRGMPLTEINVGGSGMALDLSPLAGAPLEFLCCNYTGVSDLSPLRGMPLKTLFCEGTQVSDLSPLLEVPLREIAAGKCPITDFSVLARLPMEWAKFDIVPERDLPVLREIKSLVRINDQRAVDFLRETSDQMVPRPIPPAFTNNLGMEFARVPKGKAWIARKVAETETTTGHETVVEDDFFLGLYEVTQAEWTQVMGTNPSWFARQAEGADAVKTLSEDQLSHLPVERVSWIDCQLFLKKLNELDPQPGWVYRLPTLAEWQYACRGGPMSDPAQGDLLYYTASRTNTLTPDDANFQYELTWNRPCRVGLYPPNNLGLYDMHGNVAEWCDDLAPWRAIPSRFSSGGGWIDPPSKCTASKIECPTEPFATNDLGLRVARVPVK